MTKRVKGLIPFIFLDKNCAMHGKGSVRESIMDDYIIIISASLNSKLEHKFSASGNASLEILFL
jgi:hypothetical protein